MVVVNNRRRIHRNRKTLSTTCTRNTTKHKLWRNNDICRLWYIAIIDNAGDGFFTYALGTVEEGDPHIDDAFKGRLPNTEASVSELLNIIRDGYGLNEATYKGREVNLGVPVKHGEHFFVYQKDPITLRVKKIILKDPTKKIKQIKHRRRRH